MTPAQFRAARQLVKLSREELAKAVDIPRAKLVAFEIGVLSLSDSELRILRQGLDLVGIEFIDDVGVKLRKGA
jgi:DNA-binding transcriptional regulator YiaG